jgi:hypothetical protein
LADNISLQSIADVGCVSVRAPAGVVDSGAPLVPACSVYNYGSQTASYLVRMKAGGLYNVTASVTGHTPVTTRFVTFPQVPGWPRGGPYTVTCSTEYAGDVRSSNDRAGGSFSVRVPDVGCRAIAQPAGYIDSNASVNPACTLYNNGTEVQSYQVRMRIGTRYDQVLPVSNHAPLTAVCLTFPSWLATERGALAVVCSTENSGDYNPLNNRCLGSVFMRVYDITPVSITSPTGNLDSGVPVAPRATVRNLGNTPVTTDIAFTIADGYSRTINRSIAAGAESTFSFPDWLPLIRGGHALKCSTWLANDMRPENNRMAGSVIVEVHDIAVIEIVAPTGTIQPGIIQPKAKVRNLGMVREPTAILFRINSSPPYFRSIVCGGGLPPNADTVITFGNWNALSGNYVARCSVYTQNEQVARNDTLSLAFTVAGGPVNPAWSRLADIPAGAKGKGVKDGGGLSYGEEAGNGCVYALKGNGTCEYYRYGLETGAWETRESIPAVGSAGKKKAVKKGAVIATGTGRQFAAKGNGTTEWWQYDPALHGTSTYPWIQETDVPLGAKACKEGCGAAAVTRGDTTFIYFLKGSGTQEFYRYNTAADIWQTLASAPLGASGKLYKSGSTLCSDGSSRVYCLKGTYNELFAYDVAGNTWTTLASLPLIGSSGSKKKVKDGGGLAFASGAVFALKGNNTREFWTLPVAGAWTQKEDLPVGGGKNVKGGGAITAGSGALYALKGNTTLEFYSYGPLALGDRLEAASTEQQAQGTSQPARRVPQLSVSPTVVRGPHSAIRIDYVLPKAGNTSLRLYDVAGQLVTTLASGYLGADAYSLTVVRPLPARGVYLLKLQFDDQTEVQKLVVK